MGFFERYLSLWVLLCIGAGIFIGNVGGDYIQIISGLEIAGVNIPVAILVWAMIYPMMVQVNFDALRDSSKNLKGLGLTLAVNWLIKPFTMAFFALLFFRFIFSSWIPEADADQYIAGAILLGAAPCTAMVFVWSYLAKGDPNYTLVQVSVNDLVLLIAFIPIVQLLLGVSSIAIPWDVLAMSVLIFVALPLAAGYISHRYLIQNKGEEWFKEVFLPALKPVSVVALLTTLVLLFAFQGDKIVAQPLIILLIAIPLSLQTYFIYFVSWAGGRFLKLPYTICAPAAMIGASNFFELAVAVAISLFGLHSGAALATVVGVLIEVPIMLSLVWLSKRNIY
jgi:ACR3 family arsenite transporter